MKFRRKLYIILLILAPRTTFADADNRVLRSFGAGTDADRVGVVVNAARDNPNEAYDGDRGETEGPQAVYAGDAGEVYLLNQVNGRVHPLRPPTAQ